MCSLSVNGFLPNLSLANWYRLELEVKRCCPLSVSSTRLMRESSSQIQRERESNDREEFPSETKYSVPQPKLYWDSHSVGWLVRYYQPEISPWYVMLKNYSQEKRKIICWGNSKEILCHFICLIPVEIHVPLNIKSVLGNRIRWFIPQEECVGWQTCQRILNNFFIRNFTLAWNFAMAPPRLK